MEETKKKATKPGPARPVLKLKGQRSEWHHLFKSDIQKMKKNVSFKKGAPQIVELDHTHVFHTVTSQLKPQQYTSTVGGHFHEIKWATDERGTPYIKEVGPPLTYRYVKKPSGQKKILSQVSWKDLESDHSDVLLDKHIHSFTYVHSEELFEKSIRSVQIERPLEQRMADVGIEDVG